MTPSSTWLGAPAASTSVPSRSYSRYAWAVLGLNILVILWGAFVRATGSGAGCGSHWPLCNGEVIPRSPGVETIIEFTHRLTSGLALIAVVVLVVWAFRAFPVKHRVRYGAAVSLLFILTEAALGAGLVLFRYVAGNASIGRAFYLSAHLVNTLLLLAAITVTAWWSGGRGLLRLRGQGASPWIFGGGILATIVLGVSGVVTALGDTLFPSSSLVEGVRQDLSASASFLIRLRVLHPLLALIVGSYAIFAAVWAAAGGSGRVTRRLASWLVAVVLFQLIAGLLNLLLLAPVWMQIIHLLLADLVWIALVLLTCSALTPDESSTVA